MENMLLVVVCFRNFRGFGIADAHEILMLSGFLGNQIDIIGGGVMIRVMKTGCIDIVRIFAAKLFDAVIHHLHKGGDVPLPAQSLGQNIAALVGGDDEHAFKKLLHRENFTSFDAGCAAVNT